MKTVRFIILVVILVGCSTRQSIVPTEPPIAESLPSPTVTQTKIPPTQTSTSTPAFTPSPAATAIGGGGGKIAFTSDRDGYLEIYIMNPDGSDQIALINGITPKYHPAWSPDGTIIAFATNTDDSAGLYIMNADGSNPTKLIDTKEISFYNQATPAWRFGPGCCNPTWSPDGKKIAFIIGHYIGCCFVDTYLFVMNADGSTLIGPKRYPGPVAWSPDSQALLFSCDQFDICVMNADGTNSINLTNKKQFDGNPSWFPHGEKIAFASSRNGTSDIYVMNSDGTNLVNLTNNNNASDGSPVWSPDGKKIAFGSSSQIGTSDIYVMNADGTNPIRLTNHEVSNWDPVWSPDSTKITFDSGRDGNSEIYIIDADGNNLVRLTNNDANDYSPVWAP